MPIERKADTYNMIEFVKYLPKHVLSALKGLQRHMAMTISSVSAVSVTLLLMALFFVIAGNVENFTQHVEGDLKIHVAIDSIADQDAITAMKKEIAKMQDVAAVHFSSKEEELDALIKDCLLYTSDVYKRQDIFHYVKRSSFLCGACRKQLEPLCKSTKLDSLQLSMLYRYNDFLENMIFQFKEGRDIALRPVFFHEVMQELNEDRKSVV